ncbi:MAG: trans-sulfuration enzyme family protein [Actinomycetota bacterium]
MPRGPTTRAVHSWRDAPSAPLPSAPPIVQSSTFLFDDLDEFARVADSKIEGGYLYSRWANPTVAAAMATLADLEGAGASLGFASGMAAISTTILAHVQAGQAVVAAAQLYGGTFAFLTGALKKAGIRVEFVDVADMEAVRAAVDDDTALLYCETMANPALRIADLEAWSEIARGADAPLVVDATFTPPVLLQPLAHGADVTIHSSTKYLGGHADHLGGVVSGDRRWLDPIHRTVIELGGVMAPMEAFLLHRGMQTLDIRMDRHSSNGLGLAKMLSEHPGVERVIYPGLESHPDHAKATELLKGRSGGILAVELKGGREAGRKVMQRVELFGRAASLGGTKSLIVHPASITHTQLDAEGLAAAGLTEGTLRVSVGIEDLEDLIADMEQALA